MYCEVVNCVTVSSDLGCRMAMESVKLERGDLTISISMEDLTVLKTLVLLNFKQAITCYDVIELNSIAAVYLHDNITVSMSL